MRFDKCGVYKIECTANQKVYVGSSKQIYVRWAQHRSKLRKGKSVCVILQHAWTFYGEAAFSFSVLEECVQGQLEIREQAHIDRLKPELNSLTDVATRFGKEVRAKITAACKARAAARTHCPHGHEYTAANTYFGKIKGERRCKQCNAERVSKLYAAETPEQRESRRLKTRAYYVANRERIAESMREYSATRKGAKREYDKAYRQRI